MLKWTLLLAVALTLVVGSDALAEPAARSGLKLPELSGNDGKRSLRGFKTTDDADDEERSGVEIAQKLKSMLAKSKLGQKLETLKQARAAKREAFVQKLVDEDADFATLYAKKVTGEEMYKALRVGPDDVLHGNPSLMSPNLRKARSYYAYAQRQEHKPRGVSKEHQDSKINLTPWIFALAAT